MNILVLLTVFELAHSLMREQFWKKRDASDICTLGNTGSINIPAFSLIDSLVVGRMENVPVVSYDAESGTATLHDRTSIHTTPQALYAHDTDNIDLEDCTDVNSVNCSGVYRVTPTPGVSIDVYCDMDTAGGPWTVIHNRQNGDVDFYRKWIEYKAGFGDLLGNFWLGDIMTGATCGAGDAHSSGTPDLAFGFCEGNDNLHVLTSSLSTLRIELEAWNGTVGYAEYSEFQIANEADNYKIHVTGFSGNTRDIMTGATCGAGDAHSSGTSDLAFGFCEGDNMAYIHAMQFSTFDRDNDQSDASCAVFRHGAWWYKRCSESNLNGGYPEDSGDSYTSMTWKKFFPGRGHVPMKKARMMVTKRIIFDATGDN